MNNVMGVKSGAVWSRQSEPERNYNGGVIYWRTDEGACVVQKMGDAIAFIAVRHGTPKNTAWTTSSLIPYSDRMELRITSYFVPGTERWKIDKSL